MRSRSGPGDPGSIARDLVGRAAALARVMAEVAAGARVHRGDELEARGKVGLARRARDGDAARLERLAQHFEHVAAELRQLVEEEHAVVRERDLAGTRRRAAAHERDGGSGVVRRAKGPHAEALGMKDAAREALHRRRLERFLLGHRGQDAGNARREHGLARPRRPREEERVASGGGDFERALRVRLAAHVGEIGIDGIHCNAGAVVFGERSHAREVRANVEQRARGQDLRAPRERGFGRDRFGNHEGAPFALRAEGHRERAANGAQLARERELARELERGELSPEPGAKPRGCRSRSAGRSARFPSAGRPARGSR